LYFYEIPVRLKSYSALLICCLLGGWISVSAQQKIITGIIKDLHSEEAIPFASVAFKNTKSGGLTDSSGHCWLSVKISVKEMWFEFYREMAPWMSNRLTITHTAKLPLKNLLPADSFRTINGDPLTSFEVAFRIRFAYLERFLESHFYRSSLGSPYPIGEINISHGFPGVLKSSYSYTKIFASVSDDVKIPPLGSLSWMVYGGRTFGTLPYTFLDINPGNELYYHNKYAFNMMNRWEFVHDKYAGVNLEYNIGNGIFRWFPKFRFRQFWTAKALWGSLSDANKAFNFKQGHNFQSLDGKTYLELGIGIDNILHVFRIDFVWRVLPPTLPKEGDKAFGIFGSFRLGF
jgi:hypothetical protein